MFQALLKTDKGVLTHVLIMKKEAVLINAPIAFLMSLTCLHCVYEALKIL